ncbi:MAG TPA: 1-acyl-sn-glycerol-3-phosphate acyltransferase [bacterium]|nr:1-acyl-sn-glycerol-3-phosphate acyltransferase [bacterium]
MGWKPVGAPPPEPKYVMVSQHTSNWDFVFMILFASHFRVDVSWLGKASLFRFPFGGLLRALGGIPVDRSAKHDLVAQMAGEFAKRDRLVIGIAPEGTRKYTDYWKSGFYAIARAASVPIWAMALDYAKKECGFGIRVLPSGDVRADMDTLRAYYATQTCKFPAFTAPVRLKDESGTSALPG